MGSCAAGRKNSQGFIETDISLAIKDAAQRISMDARLEVTRLGIPLTRGPEGAIPEDCYYTGTGHPRGLDSRYGEIGFVCRGQILGSGRAIL